MRLPVHSGRDWLRPGWRKGSLRARAPSAVALALALVACRPSVDRGSAPPDPSQPASAGSPSAAEGAAPSPPEPSIVGLCGSEVSMGGEVVHPLPASVFPPPQRSLLALRPVGYTRLRFAHSATRLGPPELAFVIGARGSDPTSCTILGSEGAPIAGPFAGVPSSEGWRAQLLVGRYFEVLVLLDEAAKPAVAHVTRTIFTEDGMQPSRGCAAASVEAFSGGKSVVLSCYAAADGATDNDLTMFHVVTSEGSRELRAVAKEAVAGDPRDMFRRHKIEVVVATKGDSPKIQLVVSAGHPAVAEASGAVSEDGGGVVTWTRKKTSTFEWAPGAREFRHARKLVLVPAQ